MIFLRAAFVLLLAAAAARSAPAAPSATDAKPKLAVVVNVKSPLPSTMAAARLKEIFLGNALTEKGIKLSPMNNKALLEPFLAQYATMAAGAYKQYWIKRMLSDGGAPPSMSENSEVLLSLISETGAVHYVGYVTVEEAAATKGVRVITIAEKTEKAQ